MQTGQVIGINTLKLSGNGVEGMGFAIPINDTIEIYNQLIQYGKVLRPYIGIYGIDLDEQSANYYKLPTGIYVKSVIEGSGADEAGIKVGDLITSADGTKIQSMNELNNIKENKKIGDTLTLVIYRNQEYITLNLTLKEAP